MSETNYYQTFCHIEKNVSKHDQQHVQIFLTHLFLWLSAQSVELDIHCH